MTTKERRDGSGSYFHSKQGWVAQVRTFDPFTGKSKQIRRRARNRDHARELLRQLQDDVPTPTPSAADVTVAAWLARWAAESLPQSGVAVSTMEQYRNVIVSPLSPSLGAVRLSAFTPREAEKWSARLDTATTKAGKPLSQSTKRTCFAVLSLAMDTAVRDGLIKANPLHSIKRPRKSATAVPVMSADEVDQLLVAAVGTHHEALIVFVANTGCRIGEALALTWKDVDLDRATATIRRSSLRSDSTKTRAGVRSVPLLPEVVEALRAQRSRQRMDRLKMGAAWADTEGLVFTTGQGTPVDPHNARRNLRGVLKSAGLPQDRPWHTMRHSLATRLLNRGVPMPVVASILGHASIRTTVDIYGHAEPSISADALARAMGR